MVVFAVGGYNYNSLTAPVGQTPGTCSVIGFSEGTISAVIIPATVTDPATGLYNVVSIGEDTIFPFENNIGITSLILTGPKLIKIAQNAFIGCTALTGTVTIPSSVATIGNNSFKNTGITGLVFSAPTTLVIGTGAFQTCPGLENTFVSIPANVTFTNITTTFDLLTSTENIGPLVVNSTATPVTSGALNYIQPLNVATGVNLAIIHSSVAQTVTALNIPQVPVALGGITCTVVGIAPGAFSVSRCRISGAVNIPNNILSIGNSVFQGPNGITSLDLSNVQYIGDLAFENNARLGGIISLPTGVVIGKQAFASTAITTLVGNTPKSIGNVAFMGCNSLVNNTINLTDTELVGNSAFNDIGAGNTFTFPTAATSVGLNAFNKSTVNIGNLPASLGRYTRWTATNLQAYNWGINSYNLQKVLK